MVSQYTTMQILRSSKEDVNEIMKKEGFKNNSEAVKHILDFYKGVYPFVKKSGAVVNGKSKHQSK